MPRSLIIYARKLDAPTPMRSARDYSPIVLDGLVVYIRGHVVDGDCGQALDVAGKDVRPTEVVLNTIPLP